MQKALSIFAPTFAKVPKISPLINSLKKSITLEYQPYHLNQASLLFVISNKITEQISQLQSPQSLKIINYFDRSFEHFEYDYQQAKFVLIKNDPLQIKCVIKSIDMEKFDHPFRRDTLYFHELKDIHKYYKSDPSRKKLPSNKETIQNFGNKMKHKQEESLRNSSSCRNTLNKLRIHEESSDVWLRFIIQIRRSTTQKYSQIKLKNAYNYQNGNKFDVDCRNLEEETQQILFKFLEKKSGISEQQYREMHQLAFIGGRIRTAQFMFNYFDFLVKGIEESAKNSDSEKLPFMEQQQYEEEQESEDVSDEQFQKMFKQIPDKDSHKK